jgi:hypothetical protein
VAVTRVDGVHDATFSYDRAEGYVTFDTTLTSVPEIVAELERMTAFSATERESDQTR